jgi:hypothetical protein
MILFCVLAALLAGAPALGVEAGAAKAVITPDLEKHAPVYIAGFGENRRATGIHDDLFARCLALRTSGAPLVLCGVDSIGLFSEDTDRIRALVRKKLGGEAHVAVAALHDHEAPDTMGLWGPARGVSGINEAYNDFVIERTAQAAFDAVKSLRPAALRLAEVKNKELVSYLDDDRPPVVHDPSLIILSAAEPNGRPIATLVNWANHPEALASKNTLITADYPAAFYSKLESSLGGVAVLVNGAVGGMQSPLGAKVVDPATGQEVKDGDFRKAEIIGARVAELAAAAVKSSKPVGIDRMVFRETWVEIPVENEGYKMAAAAGVFKGRKNVVGQGLVRTPVGYVRMSGGGKPVLEIALIPGEMYPELSVGGVERYAGADFPGAPIEPVIKQQMTAPYRMLFGLANDEIGYIIPKAEWDNQAPWLQNAAKRHYGEVNSVGPEAAPRIAAAFQELVRGKE